MRELAFSAAFRRTGSAQNAFSLLEMLMVFSIILVVTALLVPAIKGAREVSKKAACGSNMRQLGLAFRLYQSDHGGKYPNPWVNNSLNWQSFLCGALPNDPWIGPHTYIPANYLGAYDETAPAGSGKNGSGAGQGNNGQNNGNGGPDSGIGKLHQEGLSADSIASRLMGRLLCPTIVQRYGLTMDGVHNQWGYSINTTRIGISYDADDWPWNKPQYQGADLDTVYKKTGISGVMSCGNNPSLNSDSNWNAFNVSDPADWIAQPIHGDTVNMLFMDGHVQSVDVTTAAGRNEFNFFWYNSIPTTMANPW